MRTAARQLLCLACATSHLDGSAAAASRILGRDERDRPAEAAAAAAARGETPSVARGSKKALAGGALKLRKDAPPRRKSDAPAAGLASGSQAAKQKKKAKRWWDEIADLPPPPPCSGRGARSRLLPLPSSSMFEWQALAEKLAPASPFVVNIGANDGVGNHDPTAFWLTRPAARGLALEGSRRHLPALERNYPSADVVKTISFATPRSIGAIFSAARVPTELFFLKVDIDGYDVAVTQRILELGYRPRLLYVEIAHNFPPDVVYEVPFVENRTWGWWASSRRCPVPTPRDAEKEKGDHTGGCSAAAWQAMLARTMGDEYRLLGVLANNMLYAHRSLVQLPRARASSRGWLSPSLKCAYEEGFIKMPFYGRIGIAYADVHHWTLDKIPLTRRLEDMKQYVDDSCTMRKLKAGAGGVDFPYVLQPSDEDPAVPLRGACAVDSCSGERIALIGSPVPSGA
ncbi:hypothetical protein AB1Y20_004133 [Prymnesium parvum]|uniref:Methyltransferase FkbM domain-containing protein n=1 Tax=Prymnesium parvum TaxID=97485 RepID=A0AB34J6S1_PRYPA